MKYRHFGLGLALLAVLTVAVWARAVAQEGDARVLTVGIVPQQSASALARAWAPLLGRLSRDTGLAFRFRTAKDIPTFEQRLAHGEFDLAYMNPYHYTVFQRATGYRALVTQKDHLLRGVLVVPKSSPLQHIRELHGLTVAFPAPAAFAASVLPRSFMAQQGIAIKPVYVSSHDSVYLTVAKGLYPAGGGIVRTLDKMDADTRAQLRVLWAAPAVPPHPIAAHPRVSDAAAERVRTALLALEQDDEGRELLAALGFKGFVRAEDSRYDSIRQLDIHLLDHYLRD